MTDVMGRAARRREPRLGWRWRQSLLLAALLTALFVSVIDGSGAFRTLGSVAFFLGAFMALAYLQKARVRWALERYVVQQFGPSVPFTFEIELTRAGMRTKQLGEEILREWQNVEKITEATGGIEFDIRLGGIVFVRDAGFKSDDERLEFLRLAREYSGR